MKDNLHVLLHLARKEILDLEANTPDPMEFSLLVECWNQLWKIDEKLDEIS